MTTTAQMNLAFEPGLTARWKRIEDCVQFVVLSSRGGVDAVAAALDMAPSELGRRLSAHTEAKHGDTNNRPLRVDDMMKIIEATNDHRPIFWLLERFMSDPEAQRTAALQQLALLAPLVAGLAEQAGVSIPRAKARR